MKYPLIIFSILFSFASMAQNQIIPLYEGVVPNSKPSDMREVVDVSDSKRVSQVINPTLEVYLPAGSHSIHKAVLICPGGGYARLAYDKEGTDLAKWLNGFGIAGIVLKYRLPEDATNEVPYLSPLMDAQKGMELIRQHAEEWRIEKDKIGVMGFSAGGHLASTLGTHFEVSNRPDFMILIYPVVTMENDFTHQGSRINLLGAHPTDELVHLYSNEKQVSDNTPPTFIVHSEDDGAVPVENSIQLYLALKAHHVPVEMHLYPYGGHGFGMAIGRGRLNNWTENLKLWLEDI